MHRAGEVPEVTQGVCVPALPWSEVQQSVTNTWGRWDVEVLRCEVMGWGCSGTQLALEHLQGGGAASLLPSWPRGGHSTAEMLGGCGGGIAAAVTASLCLPVRSWPCSCCPCRSLCVPAGSRIHLVAQGEPGPILGPGWGSGLIISALNGWQLRARAMHIT